MSKEKKEKPSNQPSVGKAQWTGKGIKVPFKGGRITSQAPPKPEKPKGK
jgi:hypothetical protein